MTRSKSSWRRTGVAVGIGAVAVGALASVGTAVSPSGTPASAKQYPPDKVTICHHTSSEKNPSVTISVSQRALPAHLRHGDTIGPCPTNGPVDQASTKAQKSHGKSVERGNKGKAPGHDVASSTPATTKAVQSTSSPGQSATAPGRADTAPGRAASPPHGGTPPGHGGTPPGQDANPPADVASPPSSAGTPPGHEASPPHGGTPPGQGGTPPGQSGTPPGQGGTPPGQGGTPPGQGSNK
jgi:hypothetical protein